MPRFPSCCFWTLVVGPVPIGFDFPFYGNTFNELYVCTNGWVSFTNSTLESFSNQPLPNDGSASPENLLAPFWDDMVYDESDGNEAYYYYDGSRFILELYIRRIAEFSPPFYRMQVILYPNGNIVYQYHTLGTSLSSCTVGIQNGTKDDGLTVVHNDGSYLHEGLAVQFSSAAQWLSVSPESGVIPAGECADISVMMNAAELEAGDYYGDVNITSNDPANPSVSADVVFHVGTVDAADCDVDPNTVNLGANGAYVSAYIELFGEYDPNDVVVETVLLNGTVPADPSKSSMGDFNMNGVSDWTFKFDRAAVKAILSEGDAVEVTVTGEIEDTIYFVCTGYHVLGDRNQQPDSHRVRARPECAQPLPGCDAYHLRPARRVADRAQDLRRQRSHGPGAGERDHARGPVRRLVGRPRRERTEPCLRYLLLPSGDGQVQCDQAHVPVEVDPAAHPR